MSIVEQLARFLAGKLALPFEDCGAGASVFFGWMPEAPVRAVCVLADGLRPDGDAGGSRVQVLIRAGTDGGWALERAAEILSLLDGARDLMLVPEGAVLSRAEVERGFRFSGLAGNNTQFYAAEFVIFACQ